MEDDQEFETSPLEKIRQGVCPRNHDTKDTVCRGCYEELLRKYNDLNNKGKNKSQWHTW